MEWLKEIKAVIFDLDGTMYQHQTFHRNYLKYVVEGTEWEAHYPLLLDGIEKIFSNQSAFKMGHYYLNEDNKTFENVAEILAFSGVVMVDQGSSQRFIFGGDAWSVMNIISDRLNIAKGHRQDAFERTRKEMLIGEQTITISESLRQAIVNLDSVKRKILMTNTHAESGHEFIDELQIISLFDEIYMGSKKPIGIQEVIKSLLVREELKAHEILSIGDHPWNDLLPAQQLGCRTLLISPYDLEGKSQWDIAVNTSEEMAEVLDEISHQFVKNQ